MWPSSSGFASKSLFFSRSALSLGKLIYCLWTTFEQRTHTFVIPIPDSFLELETHVSSCQLNIDTWMFWRLLKGNLRLCLWSFPPLFSSIMLSKLESLFSHSPFSTSTQSPSPEILPPKYLFSPQLLSITTTTTTTEVRGTVISCLELPQQSPFNPFSSL